MTFKAPDKLSDDPWFPIPDELREEEPVSFQEDVNLDALTGLPVGETTQEPNNIHEVMYEFATKNRSTTLDLDPPGGSENVWQSGVG